MVHKKCQIFCALCGCSHFQSMSKERYRHLQLVLSSKKGCRSMSYYQKLWTWKCQSCNHLKLWLWWLFAHFRRPGHVWDSFRLDEAGVYHIYGVIIPDRIKIIVSSLDRTQPNLIMTNTKWKLIMHLCGESDNMLKSEIEFFGFFFVFCWFFLSQNFWRHQGILWVCVMFELYLLWFLLHCTGFSYSLKLILAVCKVFTIWWSSSSIWLTSGSLLLDYTDSIIQPFFASFSTS